MSFNYDPRVWLFSLWFFFLAWRGAGSNFNSSLSKKSFTDIVSLFFLSLYSIRLYPPVLNLQYFKLLSNQNIRKINLWRHEESLLCESPLTWPPVSFDQQQKITKKYSASTVNPPKTSHHSFSFRLKFKFKPLTTRHCIYYKIKCTHYRRYHPRCRRHHHHRNGFLNRIVSQKFKRNKRWNICNLSFFYLLLIDPLKRNLSLYDFVCVLTGWHHTSKTSLTDIIRPFISRQNSKHRKF